MLEKSGSLFGSKQRPFSFNFKQTKFKDLSRTVQGQITLFKDWDLFNKLSFFNPLFEHLLAKILSGAINDFTSSATADHNISLY